MKKLYFRKFFTSVFPPRIKMLFIYFTFALYTSANAQQTYTFTNAGATGTIGPNQTQVNNAYQSSNITGVVVSSSGIQSWTVPTSGNYRIEAYGAEGGGSTGGSNTGTVGGRGAIVKGEFSLTAGTVLQILVGQMGGSTPYGGGGGGGSYVVGSTNSPSIIAGGGGAGNGYVGYTRGCFAGGNGTVSTSGGNSNQMSGGYGGAASGTGGGALSTGGTVGYGGGGAVGAGGGGFYGAGGISTGVTPAAIAGQGFLQGGYGGDGNVTAANFGGFGGGGGGAFSSGYGGGGGGYSGGGAGNWDGTTHGNGGGGGSYNVGGNQDNMSGGNLGHGKVIITDLCKISLNPLGVNSSSALCLGNSATLTTNAVSNYLWNNGSTASSLVVSPNATTVYSLSGTAASGCTASIGFTLIVNSGAPAVSISSNTNTTCPGKSVILTGSGAVTHTWTGGVINGAAFTPSTTQTYTMTGTNGCGSATSSITINVVPLPISILASSSVVCQSKTVSLVASGATTYTWNPGNYPSASMLLTPTASAMYTVTASDGTCSGVSTISITVNPNPVITITASPAAICAGSSVNLTASGGSSYIWTGGPITGTGGTDTPTISTLYQVTGSNQFGCTSTAAQVVLVNPIPVITAKASNTLVCPGNSSTLTVTGGADNFSWSSGSTTSVSIVSPNSSTTYTVTGTVNATGCQTTQVVTVNVFEAALPASNSATICEGASITLTAAAGSNYSNYQWSPVPSSFPNVTVKPSNATTYTVSAMTSSNNVQCLSSNTIHVGVNTRPTVTGVASRTVMCRSKESVTLTAGGATSYVWINNNNNTNASIVFTTNLVQVHKLSVIGTDANGCKDTAVVTVKADACTGLNEIEKISLGVYPNPNNGTFVIKTDVSIELELYNQLGQLIDRFMLDNSNNHQADVRNLSGGVYFVTGTHQGQKVTQKILINQ